jgi:hypothetical protein
VFLLWCLVALAACAFVVASPIKFLKLLSLGRPLAKLIEKRWVLMAYRIAAAVIFAWVFGLLLQLFRR